MFYCQIFSLKKTHVATTRVIYDRVQNKKNNFEITVFWIMNKELQEQEIQIQNQMKTKTFLFSFDVLNFSALDFPRSICRKAGISKLFFLFRTLSYTTLATTIRDMRAILENLIFCHLP